MILIIIMLNETLLMDLLKPGEAERREKSDFRPGETFVLGPVSSPPVNSVIADRFVLRNDTDGASSESGISRRETNNLRQFTESEDITAADRWFLTAH